MHMRNRGVDSRSVTVAAIERTVSSEGAREDLELRQVDVRGQITLVLQLFIAAEVSNVSLFLFFVLFQKKKKKRV
jgi:hypothetical protein